MKIGGVLRVSDGSGSPFRAAAFGLGLLGLLLPVPASALMVSGPDSVREGVSYSIQYNLAGPPADGERLAFRVWIRTDVGMRAIHETEVRPEAGAGEFRFRLDTVNLPISSVRTWRRSGDRHYNFYDAVLALTPRSGGESGHARAVVMQEVPVRGCCSGPSVYLSYPTAPSGDEWPRLPDGVPATATFDPGGSGPAEGIIWTWTLQVLTGAGAMVVDSAIQGPIDSAPSYRARWRPTVPAGDPYPSLREGDGVLACLVFTAATEAGSWTGSGLILIETGVSGLHPARRDVSRPRLQSSRLLHGFPDILGRRRPPRVFR